MSAAQLQRLIALAREHDPDLYAWLASADADRRDGMPFDRALGLSGPRAIRERDEALAAAAEAMDPKGLASTWARAGKLAARLEMFERTIWPLYVDNPTAETHGVNRHLLRTWRAGQKIPRTQRALHDVLKNYREDFRQTG